MKFIPLISLLTLTIPAFAEQVRYVHDGDTIKLYTGQSIRFYGISAPEHVKPSYLGSRRTLTDYKAKGLHHK